MSYGKRITNQPEPRREHTHERQTHKQESKGSSFERGNSPGERHRGSRRRSSRSQLLGDVRQLLFDRQPQTFGSVPLRPRKESVIKATTTIKKDQVLSVYSGRPGCCCGCLGKHSYPSSPIARQVASKKRGYKIDDDEISDRNITMIVNKLNKNLGEVEDGGSYFSFETPSRLYIAYKLEG